MCKEWMKKGSLGKFWNGVQMEDGEGETSIFVAAGGYN